MNSRKMITTLALVLAVVLSSVPGFGATWTPISLGSAQTHNAVFSEAGNSFGGGLTWGGSSWGLTGATSGAQLEVSPGDIGIWANDFFLAHTAGGNAIRPVALILGEFATGFKFTTGNIQDSSIPLKVTFYNTEIEAPVYTWGLTLNHSADAYKKFSTEELNIGLFNAVLFTQGGDGGTKVFDTAGLEFGQMSYTAVPLPATVWLLGSVLGGLIMVRRRR